MAVSLTVYVARRISLTSKDAYSQTWSLAPCINTIERIWRPWETFFRHAGNHLRVFELGSRQDFEQIMEHLAMHCLNLEQLMIPDNALIYADHRADPFLRIICSRLKQFSLSKHLYAEGSKVVRRLNNVLSLPGPSVSVVKFSLPHLSKKYYEGESEVDPLLLELMKKFVKLECFSVPICPTDVDFIERLCESCPLLKRLAEVEVPVKRDEWGDFRRSGAPRLLRTRVGFNITPKYNDHTFLVPLRKSFEDHFVDFFDWLVQIGLREQVSPQDLLRFLLEALMSPTSDEPARELLTLLAAGTCPLLPSLETLKRSLFPMGPFWESSMSLPDAARFRLTVSIIGPPDPTFHERILILLLARDGNSFGPLMEAFRKVGNFDPVNFFTDRRNDPLSFRELFASVKSKQALRWLLHNVPEDQARRALRSKCRIDNSANLPIFIHYIRFEYQDLAPVVVEHFTDSSFMNIPDTDEFIAAASACISKPNLEQFKLLVETTGMRNVSAEARGAVLCCALKAVGSLQLSTRETKETQLCLNYWEACLSSNPEPAPNMLYSSRQYGHVTFSLALRAAACFSSQAMENLSKIITKYARNLCEQVEAVDPDNMLEILSAIIHLTVQDQTRTQFLVHALFVAFSRAYVKKVAVRRSGTRPLCCLFLREVSQHANIADKEKTVLYQLFQRCADADFMKENAENHLAFCDQITTDLRRAFPTLVAMDHGILVYVILSSLELINLNVPKGVATLMDMILFTDNACRMQNLPQMIEMAVRKGGRISKNESIRYHFSPPALAVYLRLLNKFE